MQQVERRKTWEGSSYCSEGRKRKRGSSRAVERKGRKGRRKGGKVRGQRGVLEEGKKDGAEREM